MHLSIPPGNMKGTMEGEASPELKLEGDIPARYVMPQQDRPSAAAGVAPIPVVDLGRLSRPDADGGAVEEEAKLRWALETWGFFMVIFLSQTRKLVIFLGTMHYYGTNFCQMV